MATAYLRIYVPDAEAQLEDFDQIQVFSATDGATYTTEETTEDTRLALVAGVDLYLFEDPNGDTDKTYKFCFFNSDTLVQSDLSSVRLRIWADTYVSLAEVRARGVGTTLSDDELGEAIRGWQGLIEEMTGQWFEPRQCTIDFDGTDTALLPLPAPPISIAAVYMHGDFENVVPADTYTAYTGRATPDQRWNPKMAMVASASTSIFDSFSRGSGKFIRGRKRHRVVGVFGFVERDGATPYFIREAMFRLIPKALPTAAGTTPQVLISGPVARVLIDKSSRTFYNPTAPTNASPGTLYTTGDVWVDSLLRRYRRRAAVVGCTIRSSWIANSVGA